MKKGCLPFDVTKSFDYKHNCPSLEGDASRIPTVKMSSIMLSAGLAVLIGAGAIIGGAINEGHRFLGDNLRPAVLDRAVWCWQDAKGEVQISASESRRDEMVVKTAILGAERAEAKKRDNPGSTQGTIEWTSRIDRDTYWLNYIYAFFWSPSDRRHLFDHVAASRPICSASSRLLTRSAS